MLNSVKCQHEESGGIGRCEGSYTVAQWPRLMFPLYRQTRGGQWLRYCAFHSWPAHSSPVLILQWIDRMANMAPDGVQAAVVALLSSSWYYRDLSLSGFREFGISGSQDRGVWGSRNLGISEPQDVGISGSRNLGISGSWNLGILGSRDLRISTSLNFLMISLRLRSVSQGYH